MKILPLLPTSKWGLTLLLLLGAAGGVILYSWY